MVDAMLLKDEVQVLRQVSYFNRIDPCKLKLLAFSSARICYNAGETLFRCGDTADCAFVVLSGTIDVVVDTGFGENVVASASRNSIIGEMCLMGEAPRAARAVARTDVEALRIGRDCFLKIIADNPKMRVDVSRALAESLRDRAMAPGLAAKANVEPVA